MSTYTTVSGDMWDADYLSENYVFPAGIVLRVPEIDMEDKTLDMLPPWRR